MASARWECLNNWLLFSYVALLVVVPWAYAVIPLIAMVLAILGWWGLYRRPAHLEGMDRQDAWWCLVLLVFAVSWLSDVYDTGHWPQTDEGEGVALPLWPALAAGLLLWLRSYGPNPWYWWMGVCAGAVGAVGIALYGRLAMLEPRASITINAIPFGNLALLLGFLALMAVLWWSCRSYGEGGARSRWPLWLALVAALSGILASLLSGTRGGWLAAPFLTGLFLLTWWRMPHHDKSRHLSWLGIVIGFVLLMAVVAIPQTGVLHRVGNAAGHLQEYWAGGERGDSVSVRLEMWRGGTRLFCQRPWMGWGEGQLEAERDVLVDRGILHPGVSNYDHLHSDLIDTAARRGLLGVIVLGLLYGVPLWLFSRRLADRSAEIRILAMAGVMIPVAFILFGLTQTMLRDPRGLCGYLGLCIGCWSVLRGEQAKLAHG